MSLCDPEEYLHDYHQLANKGPRVNAGRRKRCDCFPGKKDTDKVIVAKSIYDPQSTLSKRKQRCLHADRSDGFSTNVPYSINKQGRWKTANPATLLGNHPSCDFELCVINREVTTQGDDVTQMHVLNDDSVLAVGSAGRKKSIRHFIKQLNEKRGIDKEEVEPARILFSIVNPPRLTHLKTRELRYERVFRLDNKTRLTRKRKKWADSNTEPSMEMHPSIEDEADDNSDVFCEPTRNSNFTLGDFITSKKPSTSSPRVRRLRRSSEADSSFEIISSKPSKPAKMVDISEVTNAPHIFEIIDVKLSNLDDFDFKQEITLLLPGYCTARWFTPERVSISSNGSVEPMFVLFFEALQSLGILRIRLNMKAQQLPALDKEVLVNLLQTRKNFPSLFEDLIEFIFSLEPCAPPQAEHSRYNTCQDGFLSSANSERMTVPAVISCEHDQLDFARFYYMSDGSELASRSTDSRDRTVCSYCASPYKSDLFHSTEGMMCRQCLAFLVIRQLRLNHMPVEIPLITSSGTSPVDLLYAILPLPLMSLFLEKSYVYHCSLLYPQARLVRCPRCSTSLLVTEQNEFNCCRCSSCGCCWCYLCNWEPHWPMTCEEFKEWSEKWDTQYFFDKFNLDEGERVLRVQCRCGSIIDICAEARMLRLNQEKRTRFEDCVNNLFEDSEQNRLLDIRQTVLFLVENCTACLYLHRSDDYRHSKRMVSSLFQQFLVFHEGILNKRSGYKFAVMGMEDRVSKVIDLFRGFVVQDGP
ncbi:hypothetical protein Y032_0810g2459 [Ancylostoma ceylanicum]|uniref:IBR domain-containing protein n=1 Tax=Ancylostoma ceylanicum TaxID=53326 RepID=A0A016WCB0_9BILA|nr:hypothetical protein Y032_0810g2459 [Ancylostoma ceylanicum]